MKLKYCLLLISLLFCPFVQAEEPIKIGWIGPLTGNAAALGVDSVPAMELVFEKINQSGGINGRPIKLIVEDDQYTTKKTVAAYKKLVHQDKVKVIIVITYSGLFAIARDAEKDGVLLLDPLDCDQKIADLPSNTICIAKLTEDAARVNAEYAIRKKHLPAGVIYYQGDAFMGVVGEETIKRLEELGHKVKFKQGYTDSSSDFKTLLIKAKSLKLKSIFFYGYDQMGLAMKQARELGFNARFYALNTINSPGFKELAGDSLNGTLLSKWTPPNTNEFQDFMKEFNKKVGRDPFLLISTVPSHDIAKLIVQSLNEGAISKNGEINQPELKKFFYSLKDYQGISGNITVDPDGITRSFIIENKIYLDGELKPAP